MSKIICSKCKEPIEKSSFILYLGKKYHKTCYKKVFMASNKKIKGVEVFV